MPGPVTGWKIEHRTENNPIQCRRCKAIVTGNIVVFDGITFCCEGCMARWYDDRMEEYES